MTPHDSFSPARPPATHQATRSPIADVDLVVPVHNEERGLEGAVHTLIDLAASSLHRVTIVIADNASTDSTPAIADRLARTHSNVRSVRLDEKGRGRALKQVWLASAADVLVYTDVDLATDIALLDPMVTAISAGGADLAVAGRLTPGTEVVRGVKREIISRCYNRLLRLGLGARFSDAQCGLKAISRPAAEVLLPSVADTGWFFDTEMLTLAQWSGLRIQEFPADWTDDPDSSVDVVHTAWDDVKGMMRLRRDAKRGLLPLSEIGSRLGRRPAVPNAGAQILHFVDVGIVCTLLYSFLFALLVGTMTTGLANFLALFVSTLVNTALNRHHTFGMQSPRHQFAHHVKGLLAFAVCWGITSAALLLTATFSGPLAMVWTLLVLTVANLVGTAVRFLLLRLWVFSRGGRR